MVTSKNNFISPLDFFLEQVKSESSKTAVVCNDDKLSFYELDLLSNKLAYVMKSNGLKKNEPVGIIANKSIITIIAILAAWKVECPYVPIDIESPEIRIKYILDTCQIKFNVVDEKISSKWSKELLKDKINVIFDSKNNITGENNISWDEVLCAPSTSLDTIQSPDDLLYIIFTSGSTGQPKGVMITAENLSLFIKWCSEELGIIAKSRVLNIANFSFDQSVMDIAFMIGCGAELHLFSSLKHPLIIANYIKNSSIQILSSVPTIFGMLFDERNNLSKSNFLTLEKIFIGGAACPPSFVKIFNEKMPDVEVYNMYGPTEVTVYCMFHKFSTKELINGVEQVCLGKPLPHHTLQLISNKSESEIGELVIFGPQVMKGYWRDNERSNCVFVNTHKNKYKGYMTGDIVKLVDGEYYFVGRTNETIKSAGYRVNLSEIESAMMKIDLIKEVVVISVADRLLENIITAFVITKNEHFSENEIKKNCLDYIPEYMIPKKIFQIKEFPLNASGKIDKKQLKNIYKKE